MDIFVGNLDFYKGGFHGAFACVLRKILSAMDFRLSEDQNLELEIHISLCAKSFPPWISDYWKIRILNLKSIFPIQSLPQDCYNFCLIHNSNF